MLLNTYLPFKRINKYKLKLESKPWITLGLQKSISVRRKLLRRLLTNVINKENLILKQEFYTAKVVPAFNPLLPNVPF